MHEPVIITLLGRPVPGQRAQTKFRWLPKRQADALAALKVAASEAMKHREMLHGPLSLTAVFEMPIPSSWSIKKRLAAESGLLWPIVKPDLKNLLWLAEDALTSVVYNDDAMICRHDTIKRYSPQPKVIITVEQVQ